MSRQWKRRRFIDGTPAYTSDDDPSILSDIAIIRANQANDHRVIAALCRTIDNLIDVVEDLKNELEETNERLG